MCCLRTLQSLTGPVYDSNPTLVMCKVLHKYLPSHRVTIAYTIQYSTCCTGLEPRSSREQNLSHQHVSLWRKDCFRLVNSKRSYPSAWHISNEFLKVSKPRISADLQCLRRPKVVRWESHWLGSLSAVTLLSHPPSGCPTWDKSFILDLLPEKWRFYESRAQ